MNNNKLNSTLYYTKGFTLIVNPLRSVSRCFCALHSCNFKPRLPELRTSGFTLAETLITLVIVGVVAALTVPTLITRYQKEQTVTRLKKTYSALAQTTARAIADYGPVTTWEIGQHGNTDDAKAFLNKYVLPYMSVMKEPTTLAEGHWNSELYFLNGQPVGPDTNDGVNHQVRFYLPDGVSVSCYVQTQTTDWKRLSILIDVNGDKKPNKFGRDVFMFEYLVYVRPGHVYYPYIGKIIPDFGNGTNRQTLLSNGAWNCHKNRQGTPCAAVIVIDGWQIKDDYPW